MVAFAKKACFDAWPGLLGVTSKMHAMRQAGNMLNLQADGQWPMTDHFETETQSPRQHVCAGVLAAGVEFGCAVPVTTRGSTAAAQNDAWVLGSMHDFGHRYSTVTLLSRLRSNRKTHIVCTTRGIGRYIVIPTIEQGQARDIGS